MAQPPGDLHDPGDKAFSARPTGRGGPPRAGDLIGEQAGQDRPGVGPAPVDGRPADPGATGELGEGDALCPEVPHAAGGGGQNPVADPLRIALLIDSICNTVTHGRQ